MAINKKLISFATQAQFAAQLSAGNIDNRSIVFIEDEKRIWTHGVYFDTSWDYITGKPDDSPQDGKTYGRKDNSWTEISSGADVYDWSWLFGISPPGGPCTQQQYDDLLAAAQTGKIFPQATIVQLHPYSPESEALVIEVSVLRSTPLSDVYFISWYVLPDLTVMVQESPRGFVTDTNTDVYDWTWLYGVYENGTVTQQQYDELLAAVQTGKIFPQAVGVYAYPNPMDEDEIAVEVSAIMRGPYSVAIVNWAVLPDLNVMVNYTEISSGSGADVYDWTWLYDIYPPSGTCTQQQYNELLAAAQTGKIFPNATSVYAYPMGPDSNELAVVVGITQISLPYVGFVNWVVLPDLTVWVEETSSQNGSSITKAEIEAKLTGNITSHTHSAYVPTSRKVAGKALTGDITLAKGDVGLGNVNNTSDANKPVSTAQAAAIALKMDTSKFQVVAELPASPVTGVFYFVIE